MDSGSAETLVACGTCGDTFATAAPASAVALAPRCATCGEPTLAAVATLADERARAGRFTRPLRPAGTP